MTPTARRQKHVWHILIFTPYQHREAEVQYVKPPRPSTALTHSLSLHDDWRTCGTNTVTTWQLIYVCTTLCSVINKPHTQHISISIIPYNVEYNAYMTVLSTGNIQYNTDSIYNVTSLTLHSQISSQYNNTFW